MAGTTTRRDLAREREQQVWHLRRLGYTQAEIAESVGITQQGVSLILRRITDAFLADAKSHAEDFLAETSERLTYIYRESLLAWERSKEASRTVTRRTIPAAGDEDASEETVATVKDQDGNAEYLDTARAALADLRKLWGLDAPTAAKLDVRQASVVQFDWDALCRRTDAPDPIEQRILEAGLPAPSLNRDTH